MSDDTPTRTPDEPEGSNGLLPVSIQDEMRTSYLDYAMSVIIGRAIPDARDGLKPVHRRILYAMRGLNLTPSSSYSKCAKVVGEVLGNFHPHGDASVYDALVRMAQDFAMRHMLVDGQGNFGSVDGDSAAAYRYTECRLAKLAMDLLQDIEKDTVDFGPNFDESNQEPLVLPARFPHLLVNGSGGIAVGMATNIPPHNLREVIDATIHMIANPECSIEDLMQFIQGPDFPTGASIYGRSGIYQAYTTGRGSVMMRARTDIEKIPNTDREQIVVTELPYQVNKARLASKIGEIIRDKRVEGIREVRDESDRDGMRLVVELKKDVFPQVVLNHLYRLTDFQSSFGIINLSIVHGRPAVMNLKETLHVFVEHRREVVSRRTRFELTKAEGQREIVEGLGMATTEVDLVIKTIRESRDPEIARERLMALPLKGLEDFVRRAGRPESEIEAASKSGDYRLSERQAKAILEMRLAKLTGLEQEKLAAEYGDLSDEIAQLRAILADENKLMSLIVEELEDVKEKHGEERRTSIEENEAEIQVEDLIQEEDMVVTISHSGYIKRTAASTYEAQKRGGKGKKGMQAQADDWVTQLFIASTHAYVFFFSDLGKVYVKKVYQVPQAARNAKGRAIVNFIGLDEGERITAIAPVEAMEEDRFVITLTHQGKIKKTPLLDYKNFREKGVIGVRIEEGDKLLTAAITDGTKDLLIGTRLGKSIRFPEEQVRSMGRNTAGVKGIDLAEDDRVVGLAVSDPDRQQVLAICERGYGKRTDLSEFRQQNRGGKGIILIDASERNGPVVGLALVGEDDDLVLMTNKGQTLRTRVDQVRSTGRNAQGVRVMNVSDDEQIVALETVAEREEEASEADSEEDATEDSAALSVDVAEGDAVESDADDAGATNGDAGDSDDDDE